MLDVAERHLEEAGAELAEVIDLAGAEEAVVALAAVRRSSPFASRMRWTVAGDRVAAVTRRTSRPSMRCSIGATSG